MVRYSVQPRDQIFVKCYRCLSFAKNMCKNIGKNISKSLSGKYSLGMLDVREKLLDHAKRSGTYALKTTSKGLIQETAEALVIWLVIKLLIKLQKFQKILNEIIQKQLRMRMIKKYLKKDIYLQMKTENYW